MRRCLAVFLTLQFLCAAIPIRVDGLTQADQGGDRSTDWLWREILALSEESEMSSEEDELPHEFVSEQASTLSPQLPPEFAAPAQGPHRMLETGEGAHAARGPPPALSCR